MPDPAAFPMERLVFIIGSALVLAGAASLAASLVFIRRLIALLPPGRLRSIWHVLAFFIGFLIFGYLGYLPVAWETRKEPTELGVPVVFFFVGCLVLVVSVLSSRAAEYVGRVALLEQENITDPLTGLYNRRYLDQRMREETGKAERYRLPLSILMIDIDHFKRINDTYGHQVGDAVLNGIARVITGIARSTDIVARYGGEEILVIAPNTTISSAAAFAERIRAAVEAAPLIPAETCGGYQALPVTVSIGVASPPPGIADAQALIKSADEALYRAKEGGRNRVVVADA